MLKSLSIKNIALIEQLNIEFEKGLNVLTGETGAGKSIIIDSLNFVLGARSDKSLIRSGETSARVDAIFDIKNNLLVKNIFNEYGLDIEDDILISRTMNIEGRSDVKLNGRNITVSMLKDVTTHLVDIYGQQEQVALIKPSTQIALLDNFAGKELFKILKNYQQKLLQLKDINTNLLNYTNSFDNVEREKDYLNFVVDEISSAKINEVEEEELINLKQKLTNYEKIISSTTNMQNVLTSGLSAVSQGVSVVNGIFHFDENLVEIKNRLESVKLELDDILSEVTMYNQNADFDERKFDEIEDRLDIYKKLKRKYGNSVAEVLQFLNNSNERLQILNNSANTIKKLENQKQQLLLDLYQLSDQLDKLRKQAANELSNSLVNELADLGMPNAQFMFKFDDLDKRENNLFSYGINQVEIMFSANLGQQPKLLSKVASGGELSRVMLALKTVVAKIDNMPTMIFDEIDAGISGKMSQSVSEKIANISNLHQVLVITHSAQIAAMADTHFVVEKHEISGKTISAVKKLNQTEKIDEIARFISVEGTLDISKNSAIALIEAQQKYKQKLN